MVLTLLGTKIGMTQIFTESGNIIPVTILKVGPCVITQIKTNEFNDYSSVQIGYKNSSVKHLNQPRLGHLQKSNILPLRYLIEFPVKDPNEFKIGQLLDLKSIKLEQFVNIQGKSIGKGFSGLQKRHNFTRGPMTHGSKNHRAPGSIGMGTTPGRVLPNKKMSGQLGNKTITIKNLKVIQVNLEENLLILKGSVPGKSGNLLKIILLD